MRYVALQCARDSTLFFVAIWSTFQDHASGAGKPWKKVSWSQAKGAAWRRSFPSPSQQTGARAGGEDGRLRQRAVEGRPADKARRRLRHAAELRCEAIPQRVECCMEARHAINVSMLRAQRAVRRPALERPLAEGRRGVASYVP